MRLALSGFRENHEMDRPRIMRNGIRRKRLINGVVAVTRKIYYFGPTIKVPLRASQADSKRANAKE